MSGGILDKRQGEHSAALEIGPSPSGEQSLQLIQGLGALHSASPVGIVLHVDAEQVGQIPPFGANHRLSLDLQWGISKASFSARVDLRKGLRLFLAASSLTMSVVYRGNVGPRYRVSAAAAYGSADTPRPTLTEEVDPIDDGDTAIVPVPKYASSVLVYPTSPALLGAGFLGQVVFTRTPAPTVLAAAQTFSFAFAFPDFKVPNGAEFVQITNNTGGATGYVLVFDLAL
jgi:hypothetical protein